MQGYCVVYKWTILKRTSPEVKCLHPTSSRREISTSSVSNVIYHKFSHGLAFYTLNGKNVNVMLEFMINHVAYVETLKLRALMTYENVKIILGKTSSYPCSFVQYNVRIEIIFLTGRSPVSSVG